jgi:hypothetical protein
VEGGSLQSEGTSRMNREVHVRICERLGVNSPGLLGRRTLFLVWFRGGGMIGLGVGTLDS